MNLQNIFDICTRLAREIGQGEGGINNPLVKLGFCLNNFVNFCITDHSNINLKVVFLIGTRFAQKIAHGEDGIKSRLVNLV